MEQIQCELIGDDGGDCAVGPPAALPAPVNSEAPVRHASVNSHLTASRQPPSYSNLQMAMLESPETQQKGPVNYAKDGSGFVIEPIVSFLGAPVRLAVEHWPASATDELVVDGKAYKRRK